MNVRLNALGLSVLFPGLFLEVNGQDLVAQLADREPTFELRTPSRGPGKCGQLRLEFNMGLIV